MSIVVLKYNAGNITSVTNAMYRIGASIVVSDEPAIIKKAERIIFPGVGEASSAMTYLTSKGLDQVILNLRQPVLGICLGMQLLCRYTEENDTKGMGLFNTTLRKFNYPDISVPHMGWNQITEIRGDLFKGVSERSYVYFAHSFYSADVSETVACSMHGEKFSAALQKNNFYGTQFHPEKSGDTGEIILRNFLTL